jgi:hypothetical protein
VSLGLSQLEHDHYYVSVPDPLAAEGMLELQLDLRFASSYFLILLLGCCVHCLIKNYVAGGVA